MAENSKFQILWRLIYTYEFECLEFHFYNNDVSFVKSTAYFGQIPQSHTFSEVILHPGFAPLQGFQCYPTNH